MRSNRQEERFLGYVGHGSEALDLPICTSYLNWLWQVWTLYDSCYPYRNYQRGDHEHKSNLTQTHWLLIWSKTLDRKSSDSFTLNFRIPFFLISRCNRLKLLAFKKIEHQLVNEDESKQRWLVFLTLLLYRLLFVVRRSISGSAWRWSRRSLLIIVDSLNQLENEIYGNGTFDTTLFHPHCLPSNIISIHFFQLSLFVEMFLYFKEKVGNGWNQINMHVVPYTCIS